MSEMNRRGLGLSRALRGNPRLETLIAMARAQWEAMTPAERRAMIDEQGWGWVRAEAAFGSDADEAAYRAAVAAGDTEMVAKLEAEAEARVAAVERPNGAR